MKRLRSLEILSTRLIILSIITIIVAVPSFFAVIIRSGFTDVNTLATFVDATFKTIALLVGSIWTLNRFFVTRLDALHLRVDADVSCIPSLHFQDISSSQSLLVYRLDIVNTGNTLIKPFQHFIQIDAITPVDGKVEHMTIYRWPETDMHLGGPIEPNSWSAVSDAIAIPASTQAIRIFVYIDLANENDWSWHKVFDISHSQLTNTK